MSESEQATVSSESCVRRCRRAAISTATGAEDPKWPAQGVDERRFTKESGGGRTDRDVDCRDFLDDSAIFEDCNTRS